MRALPCLLWITSYDPPSLQVWAAIGNSGSAYIMVVVGVVVNVEVDVGVETMVVVEVVVVVGVVVINLRPWS